MMNDCGPGAAIPELHLYCSALQLYVDGRHEDQSILRQTAGRLCALPGVLAMDPERLLVMIKRECMGIDLVDPDTHAVSSPASFRYHQALDVLWIAFFARR
jgi:hypothetical protein